MTSISGKKINILTPDSEVFNIEDMAHSFSRQSRFVGHINRECYSIAQHSVNVSRLCNSQLGKKAGLIHEAEESVLGDIATPVKYLGELNAMRLVGRNIQNLVYMKFLGINKLPAEVKEMDKIAFYVEAKHLHPHLYKDLCNNFTPVYYDEIEHKSYGGFCTLEDIVNHYESKLIMDELYPNQAKKLFLDEYNSLFNEA